jgi:hypothetical protein
MTIADKWLIGATLPGLATAIWTGQNGRRYSTRNRPETDGG